MNKDELIERWRKFVTEVENGYCPDCLIQEYQNDLDIRRLIRESNLDSGVQELDNRFRKMLVGVDIRIYGNEGEISDDFWNFGYPKNASGYFLKDIKKYLNLS